MKILLLTTPWSYYELKNPGFEKPKGLTRYRDASGQGLLFPYGLLQIASVLRSSGYDVRLLDGYFKNISDITENIIKENPQLIGINTPTCLWEKTKVLLSEIRKCSPGSFLFLGGPHALFAKNECLKESPELDAVVTGEEWSVREIARCVNSKSNIEDITGVICRMESKLINNTPDCHAQSLDELPLPAYDLVNFKNYIPNIVFLDQMPFMHTFTSRGCSHRCSFCAYSHDNPLRFKSADYLMREVECLAGSLGIKTINFYDDCNIFSHNQDNAYTFCKFLRKMKMNQRPQWSIYLVNFSIKKEILREMKESGCFRINCCIESGAQESRDRIRGEKFPLEKISDKIKEINKIGISTVGRFQFGISGETYKQGLETIKFACSLPLDYAYFIRAFIMPGSEMFNIYREKGRINPDSRTWSAYQEFFSPDSMTMCELNGLIKSGYLRFYRRLCWWRRRAAAFQRYGLYWKYFQRMMNNE